MTDFNHSSPDRFIGFNNLVVDYSDGDIAIFDHVKDITGFIPLNPTTHIIAMCNAGTLTISTSAGNAVIKANDVIICPPYSQQVNCLASSDFDGKFLCLSDHIIKGLLHDKMDVWQQMIYTNQIKTFNMSEICRSEFESYYQLINSKIKNHKTVPFEILQAIIRAMLLEVCKILVNTQGKEEEQKPTQGRLLFNKFLKLITNSSIKRRPITYYASQLAITPKYLTMLCLKYSNKTASDWIVQYTIEDIRFYLKSSNLSIKEVSAKLGFANMSHFGSYVRKHLGMSPSDFRHSRETSVLS